MDTMVSVMALTPAKDVSSGEDMEIDGIDLKILKAVVTRKKFQKKQDV